jgi:hypothetical protein
MNRKVVIPTLVLLLLAMMVVTPAKAVTKEAYSAHHEVDLVDAGKVWVTDGNIQHVKDSYWIGTNEGTLGVGQIEIWYNHISLNLNTGQGTYSGKFLITIPDVGTVEGSGRGIITGFVNSAGTWEVTHCTGEFQGSKTMGSASATFTSATHFSMECVGITTYH